MAYDERLAERTRKALQGNENVLERKMFGGLAFMVNGHMCCGVQKENLMVRVGPDAYENSLSQPHAREMDFTGRPLKGMIYVATEGVRSDSDLRAWVARGLAFISTLPPK